MCQLRNVLLWSASAVLILAGGAPDATGDAPCGDLDECRVLIEINSSDGDIGFHVLLDAESWDVEIEFASESLGGGPARHDVSDPRPHPLRADRSERSLRSVR
jgi:hypothetical protein